jgi:FkbM family methyltransferase
MGTAKEFTTLKFSRKDFLLGLGGAMAGFPLGAFSYRSIRSHRRRFIDQGVLSYSQSGEDLIADFIFRYLKFYSENASYLDIGANHPVDTNNTYYFYLKGCRGVLVEPNVSLCEKLRAGRPEDTTLVAGIGVTATRAADYYVMSQPNWNTFSKEEADHQVEVTAGKVAIRQVIKMPLLDINEVMAEHFKGAPSYLSIDAEGLHLAILKTIDFGRFRPKVICVETLVSGTNRLIPEIPAFMETQEYVVRGQTFVNTLFVDSRIL